MLPSKHNPHARTPKTHAPYTHMRLGDTHVTAPAAVVLKCRYWPWAALMVSRGSGSWQVANSTWWVESGVNGEGSVRLPILQRRNTSGDTTPPRPPRARHTRPNKRPHLHVACAHAHV